MVFNVITLTVVAAVFIVCCCIHRDVLKILHRNARTQDLINSLYQKSQKKPDLERFIMYLTLCSQYQLVTARIQIADLMSEAVSQDKFELAKQFQELLNIIDELIDNAPSTAKK